LESAAISAKLKLGRGLFPQRKPIDPLIQTKPFLLQDITPKLDCESDLLKVDVNNA
jgi:hypothetical protein